MGLRFKSFTLLEMLVVIGIIGILISLGVSSYSTAQRKSRDAKRKSDLKIIQNALEQYYSICGGKYPSSINFSGTITATTTDCPGLASDVTLISMPTDPLGGNYQCVGTCNASAYTICPKNVGGGRFLETENCNSTNKSCCISNLQ
ncbi:MAG: prepilin-type N-terminal cleavage/methylation domain-containing protein [Patescibacteria group bacterium]|nr:prepilin-type N-terminal cleavage/methylation domain-containing protein [Patescibacteria group bacterium]